MKSHMRGKDTQQNAMSSYVSPERRVPADHPLRPIRAVVDMALKGLSRSFGQMYPDWGRPSIAPEKLLRAQLLQLLYSIRSERLLMEQLEYNLLFRWFVGLNVDDPVWVPTVFSKNRDRLREGEIAAKFFAQVLDQARARSGPTRRLTPVALRLGHPVTNGTGKHAVPHTVSASLVSRTVPMAKTAHKLLMYPKVIQAALIACHRVKVSRAR